VSSLANLSAADFNSALRMRPAKFQALAQRTGTLEEGSWRVRSALPRGACRGLLIGRCSGLRAEREQRRQRELRANK